MPTGFPLQAVAPPSGAAAVGPGDATVPGISAATLGRLPAGISGPGFDRQRTGIGIVHLGPGAFHRAHQAVFTNDALTLSGGDWAICGVSLRSRRVRDALAAQDGLYTLAVHDAGVECRVIGAIRELLALHEDYDRVAARLASPRTRIVTLTVTEHGYCLDSSGGLDLGRPGIQRDLAGKAPPTTAIGLLVEGLQRRRATGVDPCTVISCDNLADNGSRLRDAVAAFADRVDTGLAGWIRASVQFPCTMVDSITPATDDALRDLVRARLGLHDAWPIKRERFSQWVVEHFDGPRPDWEAAGVQFTGDVGAFEAAKLGLLNAPHSGIAYLGTLAGYRTVLEAFGDPLFEDFFLALTEREILPGLRPPRSTAGEIDLVGYRDEIFDRFRIPTIEHRLSQICSYGSQKLPQRVLGAVRGNLEADRPFGGLATIVAAWRQFCADKVRRGEAVVDPLADAIAAQGWVRDSDPVRIVDGLLGFGGLVPPDLAASGRFREALTAAVRSLGDGHRDAVRKAMQTYVSGA